MTSEHLAVSGNRTPSGRRARVGLLSVGNGAYWDQFPGLLDELRRQADRVVERLTGCGADVVARHFVSSAVEAGPAGDALRAADVDLLIVHLATYAMSNQVVPAVQRAGAPALVIDLQPRSRMDHANTDTGVWLSYCGVCSLPEVSAAFARTGVPFRSVTGHLEDARSWDRIGEWVQAAGVHAGLRTGRFGMLGHLYPGMLDIATDLTLVHDQLGGHVEVLEMDDLRTRVAATTGTQVDEVLDRTREMFEVDGSVSDDDLRWGARMAAALEAMVEDFALDSLAYYYRGLGGEEYERMGAGLILGASLLTAAGVPCAGEFDLRTSLAMLIMDRLGAGGSFTELQALNFDDSVVEMGHDGPAHLALSDGRPLLRGLGTFHGKRGHGVSVELNVRAGPVTLLGLTQRRDGRLRMVVSEGEVVPGPVLQIGNTASRVDFGRDAGEWVDEFCAAGPAHHWALGAGHRAGILGRLADLADLELVKV